MIKIKEIKERFQRIDKLINMQATGTPKQLAQRLAISERQLYKYLCFMKKELNAPIKYNKQRQSYYYNETGKIKIEWEEISKNIDLQTKIDECIKS